MPLGQTVIKIVVVVLIVIYLDVEPAVYRAYSVPKNPKTNEIDYY